MSEERTAHCKIMREEDFNVFVEKQNERAKIFLNSSVKKFILFGIPCIIFGMQYGEGQRYVNYVNGKRGTDGGCDDGPIDKYYKSYCEEHPDYDRDDPNCRDYEDIGELEDLFEAFFNYCDELQKQQVAICHWTY